MRKKVAETEKLHEISLLKQKQQLLLLTFLSCKTGHVNIP